MTNQIPKIISLWQPVGSSTHILAKKIAQKYGVKTSHTGTLDPMAEGVVIILLGEDRLKKYEYAKWLKTYEFEILFGISTDSLDGLGMITAVDFSKSMDITKSRLDIILSTFTGSYTQSVPVYSAIKVKGKPMHWYARNSQLQGVTVPKRSGEILEISLLDLQELSLNSVINDVNSKISLVKGDLRQNEVKLQWQNFLKNNTQESVKLAKIKVQMTKGLYVRSLAQDIAQKLDIPAFTYSIVRTKNGNYSKINSQSCNNLIKL